MLSRATGMPEKGFQEYLEGVLVKPARVFRKSWKRL
jgi:hypothetical protein